jgi:hypothetical protein
MILFQGRYNEKCMKHMVLSRKHAAARTNGLKTRTVGFDLKIFGEELGLCD